MLAGQATRARTSLHIALTALAILLFFPSTAWAFLVLITSFEDSMGSPTNRDLIGHLRVYGFSLPPMLICTAALVWLRDSRGLRTWLACLPAGVAVWLVIAGLGEDLGLLVRFAGPFALVAAILVWRDRLS